MKLEDLEPLVGDWTTTATLPGGDAPVSGRTSFAWLDRGGYLIQHAMMEDPVFPPGVMVIDPDSLGERIVQHYFDSRGVARVYGVTLEDGTFRLWRDGADFSQRYEGRFSPDGSTLTGAWEKSDDGSNWEHDFDLTYERIA